MHSIIKVLETLGTTADFSELPNERLNSVFNPLDIDTEVQQAIRERNVAKLEALLDVRHKIVCMINQPDPEDTPVELPEPEEEEPTQSSAWR
ncbi:hypothetical protein SAMN05660691_01964 [Rheinheimera pacifica]|uniref:Uncharacterized protein n=1 Tax=Rheinheimera pacifica TaxID=173990 RepID=A0A1H6LQR7_9GAMM|nr:hypothetical protein [Rheinheimera pacifica]SEH88723.1 hypothetical protein SAMN05660691_01964 [Rheinheimera pacifica]